MLLASSEQRPGMLLFLTTKNCVLQNVHSAESEKSCANSLELESDSICGSFEVGIAGKILCFDGKLHCLDCRGQSSRLSDPGL